MMAVSLKGEKIMMGPKEERLRGELGGRMEFVTPFFYDL